MIVSKLIGFLQGTQQQNKQRKGKGLYQKIERNRLRENNSSIEGEQQTNHQALRDAFQMAQVDIPLQSEAGLSQISSSQHLAGKGFLLLQGPH